MNIGGILIFFHCEANVRFAIETSEKILFQMALNLVGDTRRIHFGYTHFDRGTPRSLPADFTNLLKIDTRDGRMDSLKSIYDYIRRNRIEVAFGYDQPVVRPAYRTLRRAGIHTLISYVGAPMSSINRGLKLFLKRLEVGLRAWQPDHYILQSRAMADTATLGRGIRPENTSVIYSGVDAGKFKPDPTLSRYVYERFGIARDRNVLIYSGHMESRKGARVAVEAVVNLVEKWKRADVHLLLLGNRNGEEEKFAKYYTHTRAKRHITFGGYRDDIHHIMPGCYLGLVTSTGWDSFPRSGIEMAACGLPLIASNLQGIAEQVVHEKTGYLFDPGNADAAARYIHNLLEHPERHAQMAAEARRMAMEKFTVDRQIDQLTELVRRLAARKKKQPGNSRLEPPTD